jgi:transposase InsO family protein
VLALRRRRPQWGPKKLRQVLAEQQPGQTWPAPSTIGDWLKADGLIPERRRRTRVPRPAPLAQARAPNDVWTADFKGWFRTADGTRCDPLTVIDAYSRFVVCCRIVAPTEVGVRPWFERAFRTYGVPAAIRTDNGPPFASVGAARLSHLAIWWLKLGIQLDPIDPGHPEQNGRHERFHRTLQEDTARTPAADVGAQQRRFDRWRRDFNATRPHEALGQQPPARVYTPSPRAYPTHLDEPWYDATHQVRRVSPIGQISWAGELVFIGAALRGELVGLAEMANGDWCVRFMHVDLGYLQGTTRRFRPVWPTRRRGTTSAN